MEQYKNGINRATVWLWGDDLTTVRINSEKYVSKKWGGETRECAIGIVGRDRDSGVSFYVTAYTSDPKKVGELAEILLATALNLRGDIKVDYVMILLSNTILSEMESYGDNLERVDKEHQEFARILKEKMSKDPRVKAELRGKRLSVAFMIHLKCELEPSFTGKIVINAYDFNFRRVKAFVNSLSKSLISNRSAKRIVGYKLFKRDINELDIEEVYVQGDEVYVQLA